MYEVLPREARRTTSPLSSLSLAVVHLRTDAFATWTGAHKRHRARGGRNHEGAAAAARRPCCERAIRALAGKPRDSRRRFCCSATYLGLARVQPLSCAGTGGGCAPEGEQQPAAANVSRLASGRSSAVIGWLGFEWVAQPGRDRASGGPGPVLPGPSAAPVSAELSATSHAPHRLFSPNDSRPLPSPTTTTHPPSLPFNALPCPSS